MDLTQEQRDVLISSERLYQRLEYWAGALGWDMSVINRFKGFHVDVMNRVHLSNPILQPFMEGLIAHHGFYVETVKNFIRKQQGYTLAIGIDLGIEAGCMAFSAN